MNRLRLNFSEGSLSAGVGSGDTSMTSANFASLPAITSGTGNLLALTIDPEGAKEIVHVTAHTASSTTVTVTRGREGSTAAAHASAIAWVHAPTAEDFPSVTASRLPGEPDPPTSPSGYDDEFDGRSSATWLDTPTAATSWDVNSTVPDALYLYGSGTGNAYVGRMQATPPSFPYTITTKVVARGASRSYHRHGCIILAAGLTGTSDAWTFGHVWENGPVIRCMNQRFDGTWYGGPTGIVRADTPFIRVVATSASSATLHYSDDGLVWNELDTVNLGFTPTHIGLGCSQEGDGGRPAKSALGFFRVT